MCTPASIHVPCDMCVKREQIKSESCVDNTSLVEDIKKWVGPCRVRLLGYTSVAATRNKNNCATSPMLIEDIECHTHLPFIT